MSLENPVVGRVRRVARKFAARAKMPYVAEIRDFDPDGVRFEVSNPTEYHRIQEHGGETEYTAAMLALLEPNDVFWDIGACVGLVALHAARRCDVVIAFEPDPGFRGRLKHNIELNQMSNLELIPYAISDSSGTVTLYTDGVAGNSPSLRRQRGEKGAVRVESRTIDSLVDSDLPAPTVIKIDIEGAEALAVAGAEGVMSGTARPRLLFVELHNSFLPAFESTPEEVRGRLAEWGYRQVLYRAVRADQEHLILAPA